jgi:hypothetical protein
MSIEFNDTSGQPRSRRDIEEALQACKEKLIRGPIEPFQIHLTTIIVVLKEALRVRELVEQKKASP